LMAISPDPAMAAVRKSCAFDICLRFNLALTIYNFVNTLIYV
jgi:hypothetical protein